MYALQTYSRGGVPSLGRSWRPTWRIQKLEASQAGKVTVEQNADLAGTAFGGGGRWRGRGMNFLESNSLGGGWSDPEGVLGPQDPSKGSSPLPAGYPEYHHKPEDDSTKSTIKPDKARYLDLGKI